MSEYIAQDKDRDIEKYVLYLYGQTEELMTRFGKVDILWYDFSITADEKFAGKGKDTWHADKLIKKIRDLPMFIYMFLRP